MNSTDGNQTILPTRISNVEIIELNNAGGANTATLNLAQVAGLQSASIQGSTAATTISNLASASTALSAVGNTGAVTFTFANTAVSGTDNIALAVNGQTGAVVVNSSGTNDIEALTLTTTGSASTLASLAVQDDTASTARTLTINGNQALTVTAALGASLTTVDASGMTSGGAVTLTMGASVAPTVTGSLGADTLTVSAVTGDYSLNAGAGNDVITDATGWTTTDTVNGGEGVDAFSTTAALAVGYTKASPTTFTGIEQLRLSTGMANAALTVENISTEINRVELRGGITNAGASTITGNAGEFTVTVGRSATGAQRVAQNDALASALVIVDTGVAATDRLNLSNTSVDTDTGLSLNAFAGQNITSTGYERVDLSTGSVLGADNTVGTVVITPDGGTGTLNISGVNNIGTGAITAAAINASGLTGSAALTMGAAAVNVTSITGSANADTLVGDASSSIAGGAGNDTITGGASNDTILGEAGVDSITAGAGNDSIDGGLGNDVIVMASNLNASDTINGGDGVDTMSITNVTATAISAQIGARVSNIETLRFDGAGALVQDLSVFSATTLATITNNVAQSLTLSNASANVATLNFTGADAGTIIFTRETDTASNAITVSNASGIDATALTANDEETITLTSSAAGATLVSIGTVTAGDLTTLTVSGNKAYSVTTLTAANLATVTITASGNVDLGAASTNALTSINSSAAGGTVRMIAESNLANLTLVAGNGNHTISSGSGNDILTGADGADSLTGGLGNDSVSGVAGNDTIVAGAGQDTLSGGAGTDTLQTGTVASYGNDGGASAVLGLVINAGTTALLETTIDDYVQFAGANNISADLLGITASSMGRIGAVNTVSNRISSIDTFEVFTGSNGTDYIVGTSAANTITGGTGADIMTGGAGATIADTFIVSAAMSVAATAVAGLDGDDKVTATSSVTFGNGVDVITDFNAAVDLLSGLYGGALPATLVGQLAADLGAAAAYQFRGNFTAGTGAFVGAADGADTLIVYGGAGAQDDLATNTTMIVLVGTTAVTATNMIA